jgi:two-component system response regulator HydG
MRLPAPAARSPRGRSQVSARVLVIDDEEALRVSVAKIVSRLGHSVDVAGTATEGLARLAKQPYELVLTDFRLPDLDGLEVIERARALRPEAELVLFTGFASIPLAVQAIKLGAYDFVTKPFRRADLERVVARALEKQALAADNRRLRQQLDDRPDTPLGRIIGQSEAITAVLRVVEQVAPSTATVLIEGPSGTGKELVAEALHALSPRRDKPLVKVNCSAIPETLLEAELFGHEKGAFTGALARKDGRFARADGGTLFLDEVGTLTLPIQAKLLRALQDGTFEPLGSTRTLQADCRIIAATNTDLARAVKEGAFREDLYYRLNVIRIALPSLKERPDDIPLLLGHFLLFHAARNHKSLDGFESEALRALRAYDWPGNVRELSHAVERAVVLATGRTITRDCLPEAIRQAAGPAAEAVMGDKVIAVPVGTPLEDVEKLVISETLRHTGGNKAQAASMLGISTRTIYRKQAPDDGEIE